MRLRPKEVFLAAGDARPHAQGVNICPRAMHAQAVGAEGEDAGVSRRGIIPCLRGGGRHIVSISEQHRYLSFVCRSKINREISSYRRTAIDAGCVYSLADADVQVLFQDHTTKPRNITDPFLHQLLQLAQHLLPQQRLCLALVQPVVL